MILEPLKMIGEFLNNYATLILVIITGLYAFFTYRMARLMAKQVIANIQVSNIILKSDFAEEWFRDKEVSKDSYFRFYLLFDVRNKNSGSGSIDKPTLILKLTNDDFEYEIPPTTKDIEWKKCDINTQQQIVTDLGGTIFLRGGDSQKVELEYTLYNNLGDDLLKHIKENLDSLEYNIKFTDNLGKNYLVKIDDVRGRRERS